MKQAIKKLIRIINTDDFSSNNNVLTFIQNENERPFWGKAMERYYHNINIQMGYIYRKKCREAERNPVITQYFQYIAETDGIVVDLASGPSGYFSPVLQMLKEDSIFIITDACPSMVKAHSEANRKKKNVIILDVDLDKALPFKNDSISAFSGNQVCNVENYTFLLKEVYRTLKVGGKAAFIELFFEDGTDTCRYLREHGKPTATLSDYRSFCSSLGFKVIKTKFENEHSGKGEGDLLPINEKDKSLTYIVYMVK